MFIWLENNGMRNPFFRLPKMGFDNKNKDLTAANAGRADICNLMHSTSGKGRNTSWESSTRE
jgi:hypothetical protein